MKKLLAAVITGMMVTSVMAADKKAEPAKKDVKKDVKKDEKKK
jgi:hypothetical protein